MNRDSIALPVMNNAACSECPFRKRSVRGWIGGHKLPREIASIVERGRFPCHCHVNALVEGGMEFDAAVAAARPCRGGLAVMSKESKLHRDPELASVQRAAAQDPDNVASTFDSMFDFTLYHDRRPKVLILGERAVGPYTQRSENLWRNEAVRSILSLRAMSSGTTRTRLERMLGFDRDDPRIIVGNLLCPHPNPGEWSLPHARESAAKLSAWLGSDENMIVRHVITLGANVGRALLGNKVELFRVYKPLYLFGMYVTTLPHPSGRSRAMNDRASWERARAMIHHVLHHGATT